MFVQVTPTPIQIFASDEQHRYVSVAGGDTVYYGTSAVTPTSYQGTLTAGGTRLSITTPKWFVVTSDTGRGIPGSANLFVEERDELEERLAALEEGGGGGGGSGGVFVLLQDAVTGYPSRPDGTQPRIWVGWTDPIDSMEQYDIYIPVPPPA